MTHLIVIKLFADEYDRKARLYPAFLAGTPLVVIATGVYGLQPEIKSAMWGLVGTLGVIYLLANVTREAGKRIEGSLYRDWGGKPTTQLLRHRDRTIERPTKARYHNFLGQKIALPFPTPQQEQADTDGADEVYASGAMWLIDNTRDRENFPLLFKELIAYGFRRNCLGLKTIALAIAMLSIVWILSASGVITIRGMDEHALLGLPMATRIAIGVT